MHRAYHRWHAHQLGRDMELLVFGHAGVPYIVFPSSMGTFYEFEDCGMVKAVADKLEAGILQLVCASTVDTESFYDRHRHPRARVDRYLAWERYLLEDLVPFTRGLAGAETIGVTGCSFGAFHAFLMALRHPDVFTRCLTMGGAFDLARFLDGYSDGDTYLLSPPQFLPHLTDPWFLDRLRRNKWVLATGEHDICRGDTEYGGHLLASRGIPHSLHVWGDASLHDWPEWRKMAAAYLP
ncbi:MAG: alpha/beta hydrolase-fold protein [Vicinamibacterales bacterium]